MLGWLQRLAYAFVIAGLLAACADKPGKEEEEAAKNTFVCLLEGERLVIRFDSGTARILLPTGDTVVALPDTGHVRRAILQRQPGIARQGNRSDPGRPQYGDVDRACGVRALHVADQALERPPRG